jgi:transcriptional regulator with XRE-family HTH domain
VDAFGRFSKLVGSNARKARWRAQMTQEEAASEVLTFRLLAALERGGGNPTLRTLFLLARKLGVSVRDLVEVGTEKPLDEPLYAAKVEQPPRRKPSQRVQGGARRRK